MAMGTTAGLREAMPDRRTFVLSRAGFAGIQRYAANWMGDNLSRWDHLWLSMPMAPGFGMSGQAFVGADIGGFAGQLQRRAVPALDAVRRADAVLPQPLRDRQRRPVRVGVGRRAREHRPRAAIQLRYRLLPYLYAAFLRASETGAPVQRPLVFDHQYDAAVRDLDDEYLLGPRPAGRAGGRGRARPRARSTCPRATGTTGTPASVRRRRAVRDRADADGPHPALRPRRRGDPDVAGGAAVDRGLPPGGRSSCTCSCRAPTATTTRCCRRTTG